MVVLRGCTHLHSHMHYIRTIKDGSVKILMNVDANGKLKLKLRNLVDVYNHENIKDDEAIPRIPERIFRDLDDVSDMTQGSSLPGAEVNIEAEQEDFNMILDKIRRQCKEKKRKRRNLRDIESVSQVKVKQERLSLQTEDKGCDLEEPLSCWDTKFSKRKQERRTKRASTSSPSVENAGLPVFCNVKTEPWEDSYSVSEAMDITIPTGPFLDCNKESESPANTESMEEIMNDSSEDTRLVLYRSEEPNSPEMMAIEEPRTTESPTDTETVEEIMNDSSEDTRLVLYCSEEPNSLEMVAIEKPRTTELAEKAYKDASEEFNDAPEEFIDAPEEFNDAPEEFNDARNVQCCLADNIALENQENGFYGSVSMEETELEVPQNSESEVIGCVHISSNSEEVKEDDGESNVSKTITGWEIVKIEAPEIDYSVAPSVDFGEENTEIEWETEDTAKDDLAEATGFLQLTNGCDSLENSHSVPDDSTISLDEEKEEEEDQLPERLQEQPASSEHVDEAGDHKSSQVFKAPDEVTTEVETESIQQEKLHSQPEKLLSGRKALSPNSQAKLRKAMEQPSSPEKKMKKSRGKLYFSSQASHRILKAEGLETIDRVEVIPNSKQAIQKANNNNNNTRQTQTQHQRATNKLPRRDIQATKPQPFSSGCASLQGCTQKAISFSQGQMRDFQFVAAKLTTELKSMRQITKRCLLAESNTSNLDEVKILIGNAERTEESSKKWLSMIERDCNRFCKLMGMVTEDSPPATENIVQKKKKIKFADDAGGDLCHVKVFEIDLESES